ncbi:SRPBCC family protein [Taibaiella koreensis]|uniref:SRPBCC family protein n=1 Tax=Taibaiella koreensis TaxID=1268548 RepID=UPI000E59E67E|nr:SRPBCC domain-containing protein [Taibaiella koreensis]
MENKIIVVSIEINAPLDKVWSVFTNPDVTKQMGGYYDTDWKAGSPFAFKKTDGSKLTSGVLLAFEPGRLIKHSLFEPGSEAVMAVLTYEFHEKGDFTLLTGKEELSQPLDQAGFDDALAGWRAALESVKRIAEA